MSVTSFEQLANSCEILIQIYERLEFIDQLRLSRVCVALQHVFERYIWRESYRTLVVRKGPSSFCVVTNETDKNSLHLSPEELYEFLAVYADRVQDLTEVGNYAPLDLRQFTQLKSLSYVDVTLPNAYLKSINGRCPNLEFIRLCCFSQEDRNFIVIGKNLDVETVLEMKNLRRLCLHNDEYPSLKYGHFRKIVTNLKVESLNLRVALEPDETFIQADEIQSNAIQLKELSIKTTFDSRKWSSGFSSYLTNFEKLSSLTVVISDIVTDDILTVIAENCRQLEKFHISYTTFDSIRSFSLGPKVTDLTLYFCRGGLTMANIKQLLTETKLRKFRCRNTDYEDSFTDFQISPTIESLDLDGVSTDKFKLAYDGNLNLKELTWYHTLYNDYREIVTGVPLATCINLETLNMREGQMELETLLKLKNLRKLKMPHPEPFLNWSYILSLLRDHSSLNELIIRNPLISPWSEIPSDLVAEAFPTNLLHLEIPLDIFKVALDFWLDLFCCNPNFKLICYNPYHFEMEFIKTLINHPNFPARLKTIDICHFNINCNQLRTHFAETWMKYISTLGYDDSRYPFYIRLCR